MNWKLADAKNKFSKVVDLALEEGPQMVTRRDKAVMVVALKDYELLSGKKMGFKDFLMKTPSFDGLDIKRNASEMRNIDL